MKLKSIAAAAVLAVASLGAAANTFAGLTAGFSDLSITSGNFDHTITFDGLAVGWYDVVGALAASNVSWTSVTLNGNSWTTFSTPSYSFGLIQVTNLSEQLTMNLKGTATGSGWYNGGLTVSAVPEPESYALMLAGLGLIGTIALRRSKASQST